jgi:hypothetical protein
MYSSSAFALKRKVWATKIEMILFQVQIDVIISAFARNKSLTETTGFEPARV